MVEDTIIWIAHGTWIQLYRSMFSWLICAGGGNIAVHRLYEMAAVVVSMIVLRLLWILLLRWLGIQWRINSRWVAVLVVYWYGFNMLSAVPWWYSSDSSIR